MNNLRANLKIIGIIHSSYKSVSEIPKQCINEISKIKIFEKYEQGLQDIEGFTHIHIFYWLHKSKDFSLLVNTPWDNSPHGLFSTRSPHRPNPIAHMSVKLIKKIDNILIVKGLDAIDGTPVLDIKPYVKKIDIKKGVISGWIENIDLK